VKRLPISGDIAALSGRHPAVHPTAGSAGMFPLEDGDLLPKAEDFEYAWHKANAGS
jgi:hypothetical protein